MALSRTVLRRGLLLRNNLIKTHCSHLVSISNAVKTCTPLAKRMSSLSTQVVKSSTLQLFSCRPPIANGCDASGFYVGSSLLTRVLDSFRSTVHQRNSLVTYSEMMTNKNQEIRCILDRFMRLGNGLWLRRHPGFRSKRWLKIIKGKGPRKIYKSKQLVFCTKHQMKKLERIVPAQWKKPKWYVTDPYKGYDPECKFFYHPRELPWNECTAAKTQLLSRKHRTAHIRGRIGNLERERRKRSHGKVIRSLRVKMFPMQPSGFLHLAR